METGEALLFVVPTSFLITTTLLYCVVYSALSLPFVSRRLFERLPHSQVKRVLTVALASPPLLALVLLLLALGSSRTHEPPHTGHHSALCESLFSVLLHLPNLTGATALSVALHAAGWAILVATSVFCLRLAKATADLQSGLMPYLRPPSAKLDAVLTRMEMQKSPIPRSSFFEGPLPPSLSSVIGIWRPICVLSEDFVRDASPGELEAVIAHEAGHLTGRDGVTRFVLLSLGRAFFFFPAVRRLTDRWSEASEFASDEFARSVTRNERALLCAIGRMRKEQGDDVHPSSDPLLRRRLREIARFPERASFPVLQRVFLLTVLVLPLGLLAGNVDISCWMHCTVQGLAGALAH